MISTDFNIEDDLVFVNGDISINESDERHINDIIYSAPNWWKEFPNLGVNIQMFLSGPVEKDELNRAINTQLTADGYTLTYSKASIVDNQLTLDTDAERV